MSTRSPSRVAAAALSVALSGAILHLLKAKHPPSGATTLIVSLGLLAFLAASVRSDFPRWDLGFGSAFAVTRDHFADQLYRTEFRMRY